MKSDHATVREMAEADVGAVAELYKQMYAEQKSFGMVMEFNSAEIEDMLRAQLKSKLFVQYVAETGAGIQGFGIGAMLRLPKKYTLPGSESPFIGFIHDVYVDPSLRGSGTSSGLVRALELAFAREGIGYVELHVLAGNDRGKRFWAASGYRDVVQVMYKHL